MPVFQSARASAWSPPIPLAITLMLAMDTPNGLLAAMPKRARLSRSWRVVFARSAASAAATPSAIPRLENAAFLVLAHVVPGEHAAVHRDIGIRRKRLRHREREPEIEERVRALDRVRNHSAGEDDGLSERGLADDFRGLRHRVRAVDHHDAWLR